MANENITMTNRQKYTYQLQRDLDLLPVFISDHGLTSGSKHFGLLFNMPYWKILGNEEHKNSPESKSIITGSLLLTATLLLHFIYENAKPETDTLTDIESSLNGFLTEDSRQQTLVDFISIAIDYINRDQKVSPETEKQLMQGIMWIMKQFFFQN